jgi:hypothetical protein
VQERLQRRALRGGKVGERTSDSALPLGAIGEHPSVRAALDGLRPFPSDAPHAQRNSTLMQPEIGRVEIDGNELLRLLSIISRFGGKTTLDPFRVGLIDRELELDFAWQYGHGTASQVCC